MLAIALMAFVPAAFAQNDDMELVLQTGHNDWIDGLAISPDGHWLLSLDRSTIKIWDLSRRRLYATLRDFIPNPLKEACWGADSQAFYVYEAESAGHASIRAIDRQSLQTLWLASIGTEEEVYEAYYQLEGRHLSYHPELGYLSLVFSASPTSERVIRLYDPRDGSIAGQSAGISNYINGLVWHPPSRRFFFAAGDGNIYEWQPESKEARLFFRYGKVLTNLHLQEHTLATLAEDGRVLYIDIPSGKLLKKEHRIQDRDFLYESNHPMAFLPDKSLILQHTLPAGTYNGLHHYRRERTDTLSGSFTVNALDYQAGSALAAAADGEELLLWDLHNRHQIELKYTRPARFRQLEWRAAAHTLYAVEEYSGLIYGFNLARGELNITDVFFASKIRWVEERQEWFVEQAGKVIIYDGHFMPKDTAQVAPGFLLSPGIDQFSVSEDGEWLLTHSGDPGKCSITLWSRSPLQAVHTFEVDESSQRLEAIGISPNGRYCWALTSNNYFDNYRSFVYDLQQKELIYQADEESQFEFWPDRDWLRINNYAFDLSKREFLREWVRWPSVFGKAAYDIRYHDGQLWYIDYSRDTLIAMDTVNELSSIIPVGKNKVAGISEGQIYLYEAGNERPAILMAERYDKLKEGIPPDPFFFIIAPSLHFMTIKSAEDLAQFRQGGKLLSFELVEGPLNRPDRVLEQLGFADSTEIRLYRQAWEKRMALRQTAALGITELPEEAYAISIKDREALPLATTATFLTVDCQITAPSSRREEALFLGLTVNGVPDPGVKYPVGKSGSVDGLEVPLSAGMNRITIYLLNPAGQPLASTAVAVELLGQGPESGRLFIVGLGAAKYRQSGYNLTYPAKDVRDFAHFFERSMRKGQLKTLLLTDTALTRSSLGRIRQFLAEANTKDRLLFLYSGHGILTADNDLFLGSWEVDFAAPRAGGIAIAELEQLLRDCPAREKALLLDACHSGWLDDAQAKATTGKLGEGIRVRSAYQGEEPGPIPLATESPFEAMNRLFSFVNRDNGASLLTAAAGAEFAVELEEYQNGLFTYTFLEGLRSGDADYNQDQQIQLSEIKSYVERLVVERSGGQQRPTSRYTNPYADFVVADFRMADFKLLHEAASRGGLSEIRRLLESGEAEVNIAGDQGFTALHYAARDGHPDAVKLLIERGASINAQAMWGTTPLHLAARNDNQHCAALLLEAGASREASFRGYSPFKAALENCHTATATYIGPPESLSDEARDFNNLLLDIQCGEGVLLQSLSQDPDFHPDFLDHPASRSLLATAVFVGREDICRQLLALGADPNFPSTEQALPPLFFAVMGDHAAIAALLLDAGAEPDTQNLLGGSFLLMAAQNGQLEIAQHLLDAGAEPNDGDEFGSTPLHEAVNGEHIQLINALLRAGADPYRKDALGLSAYDYAQRRGGEVWRLLK